MICLWGEPAHAKDCALNRLLGESAAPVCGAGLPAAAAVTAAVQLLASAPVTVCVLLRSSSPAGSWASRAARPAPGLGTSRVRDGRAVPAQEVCSDPATLHGDHVLSPRVRDEVTATVSQRGQAEVAGAGALPGTSVGPEAEPQGRAAPVQPPEWQSRHLTWDPGSRASGFCPRPRAGLITWEVSERMKAGICWGP